MHSATFKWCVDTCRGISQGRLSCRRSFSGGSEACAVFVFGLCPLSRERAHGRSLCTIYSSAHLGGCLARNGISSTASHSVGGGTAWHRCDYGEKNAEGFFVQLKLQVVCSLRTVPDRVAHSPRYTLCSQNKASPRNSTDSSVPAWPFAFMRQLSPQPTHRPAGRTDSSSSPSRVVRSVMALPHHSTHGGSLDGGSATSLSTRPYSMQASLTPTRHALRVEQSTARPASCQVPPRT